MGAEVASALLNGGDSADGKDWSVGAFTGVRASFPGGPLSIHLDPEVGLEVARNLPHNLEVFGQGSMDKDDHSVSALAGLRWRF